MRRPVCIFAVVFAAVIWLVITLFPARDRPDPRTEGRYVTVTGRVEWTEHALKNTDFSDQGNDREYLRVSLGKVRIDAGIPKELTLPMHGDEKVLCEIREDLPEQENAAGIGAVVRIRGKLKNFRSPSNDGGFDAYTYYTLIRGYRFSLSDAHIMEYTDPGGPLRTRICRARNFFSSQLDRIYGGRDGTFGGTCASVMKAILLGQSSLADPEIKERFRDAGIVHIICISGLHISMIGTAVLRILRKAGLPLPVSSAAAFAVILVYSVMTGLQMSCVRALIMFAMQITAGMIGRTYDMLTSMSVAAVLLLIECPFYLMHSGFLFSFGAVIAAGAVMPLLPRIVRPLAITTVTLPVQLSFYFTYPLFSPALNILVILWMPMVMAGGLISVILSSLSCLFMSAGGGVPAGILYRGAVLTGEIPYRILWLYDRLCAFAERLPFSTLIPGKPPAFEIPLYYAGLVTALLIIMGNRGGRVKKALAGSAVYALSLCLILCFRFRPPFTLYLMDVGQGDGICILTGDEGGRKAILVDGGSSSKSRLADQVEVPFLRYHGISAVDYCIVTHDDTDHCSGVMELMKKSREPGGIRIRNLALPSVEDRCKGETYQKIEKLAGECGIPVTYLHRGMVLESGKLHIECLHPSKRAQYDDANAYSTVLSVEYGTFSALLTGDIEGEGESDLIRYLGEGRIDTDVLKVAHHGSGTATTSRFLRKVHFDAALISCGVRNRYGHPDPGTLKRLRDAGAVIYDTRTDGQVTISTDGCGTYSVRTFY